MASLAKGLIQVYTGNGKGKTTAALGQGLRAAGHGLRVTMIQFMKGKINYGELEALRAVDGFTLEQFGLPTFVKKGAPSPEDLRLAAEGFARAEQLLREGSVDVLILDEINVAVDYGLLTLEQVLGLIEAKPPQVELILTGRYAPPEILERADLVSEVREVKHPYAAGVQAREGIEY